MGGCLDCAGSQRGACRAGVPYLLMCALICVSIRMSAAVPSPSSFFRFAAPPVFYPLAGRLAPWFAALAAVLTAIGLYMGFFVAPTDFQQGESYRIIFIHVPSAWMAMFLYLVMAFWAGMGLVFNTRLSSMMATAVAPTGALMAFIALWSGALWGRPTWGAYWVWDARLTSTLILLFLYLGFIALQAAIDDPRRADKASAVLALVGVVNVPIIYFSVKWWNTLHQGASVKPGGSTMATTMLTAMMVMVFAFWMYSIAMTLWRVRAVILERERRTQWAQDAISARAG
jgi:heme exporter protein C